MNMLRTYPRLRKGEERLFGILHKTMELEITCFSTNIRQCSIGDQLLYMYNFGFKSVVFTFLLQAKVAVIIILIN